MEWLREVIKWQDKIVWPVKIEKPDCPSLREELTHIHSNFCGSHTYFSTLSLCSTTLAREASLAFYVIRFRNAKSWIESFLGFLLHEVLKLTCSLTSLQLGYILKIKVTINSYISFVEIRLYKFIQFICMDKVEINSYSLFLVNPKIG